MPKTLKELVGYWAVMAPGQWENQVSDDGLLDGWWAVMNDDDGIVAYFLYAEDAASYRLTQIRKVYAAG